MTSRRVVQCSECRTRVLTRTALGHADYQEFAFPCPKCAVEIRFGMTLDPPNYDYTLLRNGQWRDDLREAKHERKFDSENLVPIDPDEPMMPFMATFHLAVDPHASVEANAKRHYAVDKFWPALEKLAHHQQNRRRALFDKSASELGYPPAGTSRRKRLLILLSALDAYGDIFACGGPTARKEIAGLIKAFNNAPKGQSTLVDFFESEERITQLWEQLHGLRRRWPEIFRIVGPVYRAFDWEPARASLGEHTLSQKRFTELSKFYVDCFETFSRMSVIAAGIEGYLATRHPTVPSAKGGMSLAEFEAMNNGAKPSLLQNLKIGPLFVPFIDSKLRNGIGHHSAHYDVRFDTIFYRNQSGTNIQKATIGYVQLCEKVIRLYAQIEACAPLVHLLRANAHDDILSPPF